jgi:ABC-2 type transport system permease protein
MNAWRVMAGALRYEFWMQVRRWSVWVTMLLVSSLTFLAGANEWQDFVSRPGKEVAILWALHANFLLPVGFGVILSDRLVRDQRTNVEAVLNALPGSGLARLWGKFLGTTLATTLPLLLVYLGGLGYIFSQAHDPHVLWWALPAFAAINLPGLLCVGACSLALPVVLGVPLYQVLFVGYYRNGPESPALSSRG